MSSGFNRLPFIRQIVDFDDALRHPARFFAIVRRNLAKSRELAVGRRRDVRFRVVPYDLPQLVNGLALAASAIILFMVLFDPYLTVWQAALPTGLVQFFWFLTDFGKSGWILVGTGVVVIFTILTDASMLGAKLKVRRAVRALTAGYVFVSVAVPGLMATSIKYLLGRGRPKHFEESGSLSFNLLSSDAGWASFPSGHATTAMGLGVALALVFPRFRWVFLCAGFWIAVSRLFVRAHYPSDVLAGCLLGGIGAWLIARALARHRLVFGFDEEGRLVRRHGASGRLV